MVSQLAIVSATERSDLDTMPQGKDSVITDIHLPLRDSGELVIFDGDDDEELAMPLLMSVDYESDDFYTQVEPPCFIPAVMTPPKDEGALDVLSLGPYSFVLVTMKGNRSRTAADG